MSPYDETDVVDRNVLGIGAALIAIYAAIQGIVDLNPPSLWLDDAWVVALSNAPGYGISLVQPASAPPLFMLLVGLASDVSPDLEVGAQFFPFLFALLAVGFFARLAYRITEDVAIALFAAAIVAADPSFIVYMTRVKPFTGDMLVVVLLGFCFVNLTRTYSRQWLWTYTCVGIGGFALSSLSILVAAGSSAVAWAFLWRQGVRDRHLLFAGLALAAGAGFTAYRIASQPSADVLLDYWTNAYLSTNGLGAFTSSVVRVASTWANRLAHAGPYASGIIGGHAVLAYALAAAGATWLWREGHQLHLAAGSSVGLVCAIASAAGRLPLGTNRVGLFLLPFAAILLASALGFLRDLPTRKRQAALALVFAGALLVLPARPAPHYPRQVSAPLFERVAREITDSDGLWINHPTSYAAALYTPWDYDLVRKRGYAIPRPQLDHPGFAVLEEEAGRVVALPSKPARVYVVLCHAPRTLLASLEQHLGSERYAALERGEQTAGCVLRTYRRN